MTTSEEVQRAIASNTNDAGKTWVRITLYQRSDGLVVCRACKYARDHKDPTYHKQCEVSICRCMHVVEVP